MRSHLRSPLAPPAHRGWMPDRWRLQCVQTQARLGTGHPLTVALWATRRTVDQVLAVAAVQLAAIALLAGRDGLALLLAASVVQAGLGFRLLLLAESRRLACLNLLIEGRGGGDVEALARAQRRLVEPWRRAALARSIEDLAESHASPYISPRVIRAAAAELQEVARLVRGDDPPIAGVAFVERLMRYGTSPVFGNTAEPLRAELKRARYLLLRRG